MQVNMTEKMNFTIPILLEGEAEGVKEGGVLSQILTSVEVNCLPTNVPDNILVDVSGMELNSNMTIADIVDIPEDVEILSDLESTIATLAPPKEEEEPVIEELEDGEELPEEKKPMMVKQLLIKNSLPVIKMMAKKEIIKNPRMVDLVNDSFYWTWKSWR